MSGTIFIQPPNTMPIITEIWAFVSVDPRDGNEGVCAFYSPRYQSWIPLISADEERLAQMRRIAQKMVEDEGREIKLVKFSSREELETLIK